MIEWMPENIASYGPGFDAVISNIYTIVGIWFLLTEGILLYFIIRYRRRRGQRASYVPGNTWKSLAWILVPSLLILGFDLNFDLQQGEIWKEIKINRPPVDQEVRVVGKQFIWELTQPGRDGKLGTQDDIKTLNHLYVPVGATIGLTIEAEDVLHSFWMPNLRFKQDAVPGRAIKAWFKAVKTGDYPIACAEICGVGHGNMGGQLHVLSPEDYQTWLAQQTPNTGNVSLAPTVKKGTGS